MNSTFRKFFFLLLSILIVIFIFYNSLQNGEESSSNSQIVLEYINNFLESISVNFRFSGFFIRKLAHFIEYFLLGVSIMFTFEAFSKRTITALGYPLFLCTIIPVIDEYIQLFSEGRSSQVSDVLLDFSGSICGIIFVVIWVFFTNKRLKNRRYNFYSMKYKF